MNLDELEPLDSPCEYCGRPTPRLIYKEECRLLLCNACQILACTPTQRPSRLGTHAADSLSRD